MLSGIIPLFFLVIGALLYLFIGRPKRNTPLVTA